MPTIDVLRQMQSLPLDIKMLMTKQRIREWVREFGVDGVYVSFSGGKDSTVLLDIVRSMHPDIPAVFVDTGLEYPEIRQFVKTFDNVTILRPKMRFDEVIKKYGYPLIGKEVSLKVQNARKGGCCLNDFIKDSIRETRCGGRYSMVKYEPLLHTDFICSNICCNIMKKKPVHEYTKQTGKTPITAQMAEESRLREQQRLNNGCNGFSMKSPISNPMSFWTEQDVLQYIKEDNIKIASVYGVIIETDTDGIEYCDNLLNEKIGEYTTTGCKRTGCMFCGFGCHLEKSPNRFEMLKVTHPKQYKYCLGGGEYNEQGIWQPNSKGLGMKHVFDELNKIYGDGFIKY
jgi:3'-phosphoadenosine 5'-phosphosulfate sulfotransferase (PAPS reductase)/FAD synthetase